MNRQYIIVILTLIILLFVNVTSFSKTTYESFNKLKEVTSSIKEKGILNSLDSIAQISLQLKSTVKEDPIAKKYLVDKVLEYSQRKYGTEEGKQNLEPEENQFGDHFYAITLIDILREIDSESFFQLTKTILTNESSNLYLKNWIFDSAFRTQRIHLFIIEKDKLKEYDKQILSLAREITDPNEDRFTFGDRSDFLSYIRILTGLDMPLNINMPPLDREYGVKLAKKIINNDNFRLIDKLPYMEVVSNYDPSMKTIYINTLKEYVENESIDLQTRVRCAKKLLSFGEIDSEIVQKLEIELDKLKVGNRIIIEKHSSSNKREQ